MVMNLVARSRRKQNVQFFSVPIKPVERHEAFQECSGGTADRDFLHFVNLPSPFGTFIAFGNSSDQITYEPPSVCSCELHTLLLVNILTELSLYI
jgi:hypothetical protein